MPSHMHSKVISHRRLAWIEPSPAMNMRLVAGKVPAILDGRDVEVDDVAVFQRPVAGYAVADLLVDRGTDGFGVGS